MAFWNLEVVLTSMYFLIKPNTACSTEAELSVVSIYNNCKWLFDYFDYSNTLNIILDWTAFQFAQPVRNMFPLAMLLHKNTKFSIQNVCIFVYKSIILCGEPTCNTVVLSLSIFLRHELFCFNAFSVFPRMSPWFTHVSLPEL